MHFHEKYMHSWQAYVIHKFIYNLSSSVKTHDYERDVFLDSSWE